MNEERGAVFAAASIAVGLVMLVAFLFEMAERPSIHDFPQETLLRARDLVRRGLDAGSTAQQDTDPVMAIAHATEATTLLNTARELMPIGALNAACGNIDIVGITERFHATREAAARALRPQVRPSTITTRTPAQSPGAAGSE